MPSDPPVSNNNEHVSADVPQFKNEESQSSPSENRPAEHEQPLNPGSNQKSVETYPGNDAAISAPEPVEPGTLPSRGDAEATQKHAKVERPVSSTSRAAIQSSLLDDGVEPGPVERASAKLVAIVKGSRLGTPFYARPQKVQGTDLAAQRLRRRRTVHYLTRKHSRQMRAGESRSKRRVWIATASVLLTILVIFLSLGGAGGFYSYQFFTQTQTKYERNITTLRDLLPRDNLKIYDSKGVLLTEMTNMGYHTTVNLDQISVHLQRATIATEDKNFWTNQGVDVFRILQAAIEDLTHGHVVQGGSTITQQLIKNLVVGNETSITRKLEEIVLTPQLNSHYSKHDILEMYLNSIYYGNHSYGIDAAAMNYFGLQDKPNQPASAQLDIAQAAMLAGIPSSPTMYNPLLFPDAATARFKTVLSLMNTQGYITRAQELDAIQEQQDPHFFKQPKAVPNRAPHFTNFVEQQLQQQFHLTNDQLARSGMSVYTTLDIKLQDKIQKVAQQHVAELNGNNVTNSAEVMMDYHTGAIISLLGSIDYNNRGIDGQYDVATQAYRQPGSSFKPYVYATAFKQGFSPGQAISDEATTFPNPGSDPYAPQNYDRNFHGQMTLRCALQNSLNVPAVKTLDHVGINNALKTAQSMGINTYKGFAGLSMVLGGISVKLIDQTTGFGTFANGGVHVPYYTVTKIYMNNDTGKPYFTHQATKGTRAISPQIAYMMTNVLTDNEDRIPDFGACNVLELYSNSQDSCYGGDKGTVRPAAAKTGTTEDFRDNWTVGYTTDYVMGVWTGNDNNTPMYGVNGVQGAAPIWHDSMLLAEQGKPIRDFTNPGGLHQQTVTYPNGVTSTDWFLDGSGPAFQQQSNQQGSIDTGSKALLAPRPKKPPVQKAPFCPSYYFSGGDIGYGTVW